MANAYGERQTKAPLLLHQSEGTLVMKSNALIVTAHPYSHSFNLAMSTLAEQTLVQSNWTVETSNLYQQGFSPVTGTHDFVDLVASAGANLLQLQAKAFGKDRFAEDIVSEQAKINRADLIILQFPIWWGSMPAMLKGWLERVLTYGYAYGEQFALENKPVMMAVTTGGARDEAELTYYRDKMKALSDDIFGYMKMDCQPSFICHGPAASTQAHRLAELDRYKDNLNTLLAALD